ncbi:hypothetical protein F5882DRAFT_441943 [Hyaloscypha sp. PMI_1271]|nr:hypothetical protein F5882DRAFT_441943 [Hyaloscypha sp. PMI_1271]
MDSNATSAIQLIRPSAHSIMEPTDDFSIDNSNPGFRAGMKGVLQSIQISAGMIECASKDLSESNEPRFSLFPKFPAELRLKIWKLALPGPRIVEVYYDRAKHPWDESFIRFNTPPPSVLHANWESRRVALEKYWLRIGSEGFKGCFAQIDPTEDTVFIPFNSLMKLQQRLINGKAWSKEAKESVRSLAVDARSWKRLCGPEGFVYFENLEKFTIVIHDSAKCQSKEKWGVRDTDLSLIDVQDEVEVYDHHLSVESQMEFDNGHYGRQWKLPTIEVKVAARGGKKCYHT